MQKSELLMNPDMEKNPSNLIAVSGAGGAGKTKLIEELLLQINPNICIPGDPHKLKRKTYDRNKTWEGHENAAFKYSLEYLETDFVRQQNLNNLALENPKKIILADECALDNLAYILAGEANRDLSHSQASELVKKYNSMLKICPLPKNIILLHYPQEIVFSHIENRTKTEGRSYRDYDFKYHKHVIDAFKTVFSSIDCLKIGNPNEAIKMSLGFIGGVEKKVTKIL